MNKIRRIELLDVNDPNYSDMILEMVAKSLRQTGPMTPRRIIIVSDGTLEGRKKIQQLLSEGYKIESIRD